MYVIIQVDAQQTRAIRILPIQYTAEAEAQAHAQVLSARHSAAHHAVQFVVRPLQKSPSRMDSPATT
ncbi:MAG: hypothetical protein KJ060_15640 [Candidatus Hydrogenedentes bacterium]|nr:hypothetical protein [Candidatus Hydrogenedentota bacterium]